MQAKLTMLKDSTGRVASVAVSFTDNDGRIVSVAFADRPVVTNESCGWTRTEFDEYTNTPVMTPGGDVRPLSDLSVLLADLNEPVVPVAQDDMPWGV